MHLLRHRTPAPVTPGPADRRHVVTVLRLVVSKRGTILFGEAIDAETLQRRRFRGWRGLAASLRAVVAGAGEDGDHAVPAMPTREDRSSSPGEDRSLSPGER